MSVKIGMPGGAPESEFSEPFVERMINAMAMSFFKYGPLADAYPHRVDAIRSLLVRLKRYLGDELFNEAVEFARDARAPEEHVGNTEWLTDVANFSMIEFMRPRHPKAYHKQLDSAASPGRKWVGETDSSARSHRVERVHED